MLEMLINHLLNTKNKMHELVDAHHAKANVSKDMKAFIALQHIHKLGHGQCHSLTLALHDFTDLPIYLLVDNNGESMHSYLKYKDYSLDAYLLSDESLTISFYESIGNKNGRCGSHPIMVTRKLFLKSFENVCAP